MNLTIIFILIFIIIVLSYLNASREGYWDIYEMPNAIPKTFISSANIRNKSCYQDQRLY